MAGAAGIQVPFIVRFTESAAAAATHNYTMTRAGRIVDMWANSITGGGGAETLQLIHVRGVTVNNLTNAMALPAFGGGANLVRPATIDFTFADILAGDILRFTTAGAGTAHADAYVTVVPPLSNPVTLT